jgi:hypothetical protein
MIKKLIYKIMNDKVAGLIRHGLTFIGGYLVTDGIIDESTLTEVVGAIITLVGFIWSWKAKKDETPQK